MLSGRKVYEMVRVNVLRRRRKLRQEPLARFLLVVPVVFFSIMFVGRLPIPGYEMIRSQPGAYVFGTQVGDALEAGFLDRARRIASMSFLAFAFVVGVRATRAGDTVSTDVDLYLTMVRPGTVVGSEILKYVVLIGQFAGLIFFSSALAFGIGSRDPLSGVLILLASTMVVLTAASLSYFAALSVKWTFVRWPRIGQRKRLLGSIVLFSFVVVMVTDRQSGSILAGTPLGWYADLAFLTTVPASDPVRAGAVTVLTLLSVAVSFLGSRAMCERIWLSDSIGPADEETSDREESAPTSVIEPLTRVVPKPVVRVMVMTWRRIYRKPTALVYVVSTAALVFVLASTITEALPNSAPTVVAIYGSAMVGMGATLNPLGNEGVALPAILTARNGSTYLLAGQALSATLPGVVLVGGATLVAGAVTGAPLSVVVPAIVVAVVLAAAVGPISLAVGVLLPQYEGVELTANKGIQTPRPQAVGALVLSVVVLGIPAMVGIHGPNTPVSPVAGTVAGVTLTILGAAAAGVWSFRFALDRVETFRIE